MTLKIEDDTASERRIISKDDTVIAAYSVNPDGLISLLRAVDAVADDEDDPPDDSDDSE